MTKSYCSPTVTSIGAVDKLTTGGPGTISEAAPAGHPIWTRTTHSMVDL
jgi:hypothetical protein